VDYLARKFFDKVKKKAKKNTKKRITPEMQKKYNAVFNRKKYIDNAVAKASKPKSKKYKK